MRWIPTLVCCLLTGFSGIAAHAAGEIAAEPSAITAGQATTLKWFFKGVKLTVSGGSFAPGTVITDKLTLTVRPKKTTKYLFDLYFRSGKSVEEQTAAGGKLTHVQYSVTVEVLSATMPGLLAYKGTHNWRVNYQTGWTPMPNREGNDDVIFFQPEEDAVERLAVAIVPVKSRTAAELMEEVRADIPSSYTHYEFVSKTETTHQNLPAIVTTFTGNTAAHPDTRTQSMLMVFINGGKGYVVSARTAASRFSVRRAAMEKMLNSFVLTGKIDPAPATLGANSTTPALDSKPGATTASSPK